MESEETTDELWPSIREAYEEILAGNSIGCVMGFNDPECVVTLTVRPPSIVIDITMSLGDSSLVDKVAESTGQVWEDSRWLVIDETGETK